MSAGSGDTTTTRLTGDPRTEARAAASGRPGGRVSELSGIDELLQSFPSPRSKGRAPLDQAAGAVDAQAMRSPVGGSSFSRAAEGATSGGSEASAASVSSHGSSSSGGGPDPPLTMEAIRTLLHRLAREPWTTSGGVGDPLPPGAGVRPSSAASGSGGSTAGDGWDARLEAVRSWMMAAPHHDVEDAWNSVLDAIVHGERRRA